MNLKKTVIRSAMASAFAAAALITAHAVAGIGYGYEMDYFSDASQTNIVGNKTVSCDNKVVVSGSQTAYSKEVMRWSCDIGWPNRAPVGW